MDGFALLVLESPWSTPKENPSRESVLPFFQALERLHNRFNIYYSTFYDAAGFNKALEEDLKHTHEKRQIIYIGAHGRTGSIAGGRASTILSKIGVASPKIRGVIVSSCDVGLKSPSLEYAFEGSVRWVFGYTATVNWLASQLIELAILEAICLSEDRFDEVSDLLIDVLGIALSRFNPYFKIDDDDTMLWKGFKVLHKGKKQKTVYDISEDIVIRAWPEFHLLKNGHLK